MFFKKRIPVAAYCERKLQAMFSQEQSQDWLRLKDDMTDPTMRSVAGCRFIDEMLGANLQLFSMAIAKQYRDIDMMFEVNSCVKGFLEKNQSAALSSAKGEYNKAFGSPTTDGILEMVRIFNSRTADGKLSSGAETAIADSIYKTLATYFVDFKTFKLVKSR